jgi:hypothetical protein
VAVLTVGCHGNYRGVTRYLPWGCAVTTVGSAANYRHGKYRARSIVWPGSDSGNRILGRVGELGLEKDACFPKLVVFATTPQFHGGNRHGVSV